MDNFNQGLASYGAPVAGGLPITTGKYLFVNADTGSDGNDGLSLENWSERERKRTKDSGCAYCGRK